MAEGFARRFLGSRADVFSAGIQKHGLNPDAVKVMAEAGVDISTHKSKTLDELGTLDFDLVVTVCDHANESCPVFPGECAKRHHSFDDPPRLAAGETTEERRLHHYRRVRDEIEAYIQKLAQEWPGAHSGF